MNSLNIMFNDWVPLAIARWIRPCRVRGIRFNGNFGTWQEAEAQCIGYNNLIILEKVLTATLKVIRGEAAFERDSVLFNEVQYEWPLLTGLMWAAAQNNGRLSVLDFGGALGSSYFQNKNILNTLSDVRWNIVEQKHYVEAGQAYIQEKNLRFFNSIKECLTESEPNVILLSSVLQYLENPNEVIHQLTRAGASTLIIDRTPFSSSAQDKLMIQRVPPTIYKASYPMWVFSKDAFLKNLSNDWRLVATTPCPEGKVNSRKGFEFIFEGLIMESLH